MAGTTAWDNLSFEMSQADSSKFKRQAIALLRVLNSSFEECSDIPGADLIVMSDRNKFDWVVQCQIFDTEVELGEAHVNQINSILTAFLNQGFTCNKYWVLHNHQHGNRSGKFIKFLNGVERLKKESNISEKIDEFVVFQRQEFIQIVEKQFRNLLIHLFQRYSDRYRLEIEEKLEFGKYYVSEVPSEEFEIFFREFNPCPNIEKVQDSTSLEVSSLVISKRKDFRWTLMHGEAGAGKTTTALHAAMAKDRTVLFINCDILNFYSLRSGTNFLFEHILRALEILDEEFEDERDRELLYSLSGATLPKTLSRSEKYVLVFDGLDENRFYSEPKNNGLKRLSDRLSDIHCPIILVTRTSHFYESLYNELVTLSGKRGGTKARKKARAVKLSQWTKNQVLQLIIRVLDEQKNKLSLERYHRLERFKEAIIDDSYKIFYGDLPLNPLFLQFILSDVAERDIQKANRPTLIYQWVRQKIYRDIQKENRSFVIDKKLSTSSLFDIIDKVLYVMERTSKGMIVKREDYTFELIDFTESQEVEKIAAHIFQISKVEIIDLLLNSVLTSRATLTRDKYRSTRHKITFLFRIFQEYFLACNLVRNNEDYSKYPSSIQSFCSEITETDSESDIWFYLNQRFDLSKGCNVLNKNRDEDELANVKSSPFLVKNLTIYQRYSTHNTKEGDTMTEQNFYGPTGNVAGTNYGSMTAYINQNSNDIARLLTALRESAQAFPEEQKEEALMELDDLESDLKTPEKQNPKRIGKRLQRLLAAGTAAATVAGGAATFSGDLKEFATNVNEFAANAIELGEKIGIEIKPEQENP